MKRSITKRVGLLSAALLSVAAFGCGGTQRRAVTEPTETPGICQLSRPPPRGGATALIVRSLRPEQWFQLLLRGFTQTSTSGNMTGNVARPLEDCTGTRITWPETDESCIERPAEPEAVDPRPLTEDDLVIQRTANGMRIVWAIVQRFNNGEGLGPVALVEFNRSAVNVRAIGTLRAQPRRARLRIETIDPDRLLVTEGEHCTDDEDPTTCRRSVRLMSVRENRFVPGVLTFENGDCIGPARFDLARDETASLGTGYDRRFELTSSLTFNATAIVVHEQMVVADEDPSNLNLPRRLFRRSDSDRTINIVNGRLVTNTVSLWSRILDARASVRGGLPGGR